MVISALHSCFLYLQLINTIIPLSLSLSLALSLSLSLSLSISTHEALQMRRMCVVCVVCVCVVCVCCVCVLCVCVCVCCVCVLCVWINMCTWTAPDPKNLSSFPYEQHSIRVPPCLLPLNTPLRACSLYMSLYKHTYKIPRSHQPFE